MPASPRLAIYASCGANLTHYDVDVAGAALTKRATIEMPQMVQYIWPHASRRWLYVAVSSRGPGMSGTEHHLCVLRVDPATGALSHHGKPVPLHTRPIHLTTDLASEHVLVAYNTPSSLTVHRILADGTIGEETSRAMPPETGIYAHQVRMLPSGKGAVLVARGHDAAGDKAEEPGELAVFDLAGGRLKKRASIAPEGGFGFGPRHIDFHPTRPWLYVSLERQNALALYRMNGDDIEPAPAATVPTLVKPGPRGKRQLACTVHVHPNGRFVYVPNRAYEHTVENGVRMAVGGENNLAAYAIDPQTGAPSLIQHVDAHGYGVRTFSIDPGGTLLVAGTLMELSVRDGATVRKVPTALVLYRIGEDGRLTFVRKYDVETGLEQQFWTGMVELPAA